MKKIMLAAMAALAITGCSQNEEFDSMANKSEINFTSAAITRANHATVDNFTKFIVYGYSHTGEFAGTGTVMIGGVKFTKSDNNWIAADNAKFYWPLEKNLSFIAYSSTAEDPTTGVTYTSETTGYPTLKYSVATTDQEDLLVAQVANKNKDTGAAGVSLTFKHALAQIGFSLQGEDTNVTYKVTGITIKGAKNSGTFTYGANPDTSMGSWAVGATTADYAIALTNVSFAGGASAALLTGEELILMPQDQTSLANVTIDVAYTATKNNEVICNGIAGVKLPTTGKGSEWKVGIKTTYLLTLTPGAEIKLSGELGTWTEEADPIK